MLCKCPQLTPLQSRFVASFLALCLMGLVLWRLGNAQFAYAAELGDETTHGEDHNWHRIQAFLEADLLSGMHWGSAEDALEGRDGATVKRQADVNSISRNDGPNNLNAVPGSTQVWKYSRELLAMPHANLGTGLPSAIGDDGFMTEGDRHRELRRQAEGAVADHGSLGERQLQTKATYISMNTCLQPAYNGTGTQTAAPPQLTLYVALTNDNQTPGPASRKLQRVEPLVEGYVNITLPAYVGQDLYMAVEAPSLTDGYSGEWNYDIAVSIDNYYHRLVTNTTLLYLVDTDTEAALLVTDNLTQADSASVIYQQWMNLSTPFMMFANDANSTSTLGLSNSFCGLQKNSQFQAPQVDAAGLTNIQTGMVTRGLGNKPKQQFYINALNGSSLYYGTLAMNGNSSASGAGVVGGGGTVWPTMNWTTKADGNCQLMFNLTFCDQVAYAVPSNNITFPIRNDLQALYDSYAGNIYNQFDYSLQQLPCDNANDSRYSLAKDCTDCRTAVKEWLCAVSIPRCEDWSNNASWLQPRNMAQAFINDTYLPASTLDANYTSLMVGAPSLPGSPARMQTYNSTFASNQSRNTAVVDAQVKPGPYKEVLPCEDLCFSLVQSCPAALTFSCPPRGVGLNESYGKRSDDGTLTCSYLGAVYYLNAGTTTVSRLELSYLWFVAAITTVFLLQ